MSRTIITLTADWGVRDFFAGMVKGRLYSSLPDVQVVDLALGLEPYNIIPAIYVVRHACQGFPEGTIHIVDVNSVETIDQSFVVVKSHGQYLIGTDNGLPNAVFGDDFDEAVQINTYQDGDYYTFAAYNLFCKVAIMLAQGTPLSDIGDPMPTLNRRQLPSFFEEGGHLKVYVTYTDNYGNAYLALTIKEFEAIRRGRRFRLMVREYMVNEVSHGYDPGRPTARNSARLLLTVSATGHLEIALKEASAAKLLGLRTGEAVLIYFDE
ncbi:MAG: SAM-dependent chlorinase/fluorinase [Bacteroidales bacterium]|nr:SAM-dependent chlorinase/fluorinase [Bacteroidales bacterium]